MNPASKGELMALADMHVHSQHSLDGDEWFLKQIGASESYTQVEELYAMAKKSGMDYVTLTDHNTIEGALELVRRHPKDAFTGVETTALFPETGCKVHLLIYDLNEVQFDQIQLLRKNIYKLRDYLRDQNLPCSVAHATFAVNGKLSMDILEKLILLFDLFEGTNGSRSATHNSVWTKSLESLRPDDIDALYAKHKIEPWSKNAWIKGFTGGSDDHAGALVGKTHTYASAKTKEDFLQALRDKNTFAAGRSNNFKAMAFVFSKIGNEIATGGKSYKGGVVSDVFRNVILKNKRPQLATLLTAFVLQKSRNEKRRAVGEFLGGLLESAREKKKCPLDEKINSMYDNVSLLYDNLLKITIREIGADLRTGRAVKVLRNFFNMMPAMLLGVPFFTTVKLLHQNRRIMDQLRERFLRETKSSSQGKVLWFTDSVRRVKDAPAVLRRMHRCFRGQKNVRIVVSMREKEAPGISGNHFLNLPPVAIYTPSMLKGYSLKFPSLLKSLEMIQQLDPQEIRVDTPGPMGLLGLMAARLLDIPCVGFHLADAETLAAQILDQEKLDPDVTDLIKKYVKWFSTLPDEDLILKSRRSSLISQAQEPFQFKEFLGQNEPEAVV